MYGFIWRHLPGGLIVRIITAMLLVGVAGAVLWYLVFPWLETHAPLERVTMGR
jgi:hypothetical protein